MTSVEMGNEWYESAELNPLVIEELRSVDQGTSAIFGGAIVMASLIACGAIFAVFKVVQHFR